MSLKIDTLLHDNDPNIVFLGSNQNGLIVTGILRAIKIQLKIEKEMRQ